MKDATIRLNPSVAKRKMKEAKCQKCGYEWNTNSEMVLVSCPSCGNKVKVREVNEDKDKK